MAMFHLTTGIVSRGSSACSGKRSERQGGETGDADGVGGGVPGSHPFQRPSCIPALRQQLHVFIVSVLHSNDFKQDGHVQSSGLFWILIFLEKLSNSSLGFQVIMLC